MAFTQSGNVTAPLLPLSRRMSDDKSVRVSGRRALQFRYTSGAYAALVAHGDDGKREDVSGGIAEAISTNLDVGVPPADGDETLQFRWDDEVDDR
jgi:hypothetical protein